MLITLLAGEPPTPDEQIERADRLIEQERQRADRLAAKLRALGIDPD